MAEAPFRESQDEASENGIHRNGLPRHHGTPTGTPPPVSKTVYHLPSNGDREARRRRIAESAYYRAERRGFAPGGEVSDWLEAEKELGENSEKSDAR